MITAGPGSLDAESGGRRHPPIAAGDEAQHAGDPRVENLDVGPAPSGGHALTVRLLGKFDVCVDGQPVGVWDSPRGLAIFKYVLIHRSCPVARDVLTEVFWPDVAPKPARNRFHVALSSLRRSLRAAGDTPIVVFRDGAYMVNPALDLDVDVDEFLESVGAGERAQCEGNAERAIRSFEQAITLYRGDLLAESPYEDWALLARETLRVRYLNTLDRMAALYLAEDSLVPCIAVGQLILQQDPCREDAHRLLMRCYARQGRVREAIRQFDFCSRALRADLASEPSAATLALYRAIRTNRAELPGGELREN